MTSFQRITLGDRYSFAVERRVALRRMEAAGSNSAAFLLEPMEGEPSLQSENRHRVLPAEVGMAMHYPVSRRCRSIREMKPQ